ncbi:WhiB family transcriptional regulator [Janibacter hoylei]|uniref:Transcriptional regulator WhiB n=1 Tax=Janibacter hoylei PVAS-1 TaxID=1210046 RepID=K1E0V6_9MICO|nr:WhiB family transcriptional regulator [Janibacter hoylei]EKA62520.1 Transcription factor WhiB [Janibacter hoylei PVAS-1]MCT1619398.1 WhiB family transcriptional regulator [Janibacter hoylei]MCW4601149.1 WhiB family transcriptional regulator [Janibacter hoylei]RWU84729.1 WhiB family transcriptional regulator [Janibacter hoylei PVAS-1]
MGHDGTAPGPVADLWEWQFEGACRETGSESFYHPDGERGAARRLRDAAAKEICSSCPVIAACRAHALAIREPFGVWGGMTEDERQVVLAGRDISRAGLAG